MLESHCEILWADSSRVILGSHLTANYTSGLDDLYIQETISQKRLRSKTLGIWIKNSLTTDAKRS